MDIDVPVSKDITFSSDNAAKGKRSAANLPVEAEDSLPWYVHHSLVSIDWLFSNIYPIRVEKYRPATLADVSGHQDILATINKFVDSNRLPHLLLYGPPGTGKTSTILALARRIYGAENVRQMVLELNASDDRGIDVVREQIKTFASTKQIFSLGVNTAKAGGSSIAAYKLIILDEADAMTNTAQMALRRIMEKYTANTRFCIIANYSHKLSPALLSRCTRFRFSPLKERDIRVLVDKVIEEENVKILPEATDALVRLSKGDMRRALNVLQACHASSKLSSREDASLVRDAAANIRGCRYSVTTERCAQDPRKGHRPRYDHNGDNLQLHRGAASRRDQEDPRHAPEHERCHVVPCDYQHAQSSAGPGAGGYHHGTLGRGSKAAGQAGGHDLLACRPGRYRAPRCGRRFGGGADRCDGWRDTEWSGVDGLKTRPGEWSGRAALSGPGGWSADRRFTLLALVVTGQRFEVKWRMTRGMNDSTQYPKRSPMARSFYCVVRDGEPYAGGRARISMSSISLLLAHLVWSLQYDVGRVPA